MQIFTKRKHHQIVHRPKKKWSWNRLQYLGVGVFVMLILLLPALKNMLNPSSARADWYDENYAYRKKISLSNAGSALTNRKVKFDIDTATLITAGAMQSDCDDIRFTDQNGKQVPYYAD